MVEPVSASSRSVLISVNPKSGASDQRRLIDQLVEALETRGFEAHAIQDVDELCRMTTELQDQGKLRTVVAAGGDGTASLLVNRLPAGVPLTILPLGTANLLAKYLLMTASVDDLVDTIEHGKVVSLDAGRANDRLFLVVASCGFDADVVQRIHSHREGHISYWSYGWPIIDAIRNYRFPRMSVVIDGQEIGRVRWAFIFNLPQYAMNLKFIADANGRDGRLNICTFREGGFLKGLYYFFAVLFRRHRFSSSTQFHDFETLRIESDQPVPIELDGDPAGHLPLDINVIPGRLKVLVPEKWLRQNVSE